MMSPAGAGRLSKPPRSQRLAAGCRLPTAHAGARTAARPAATHSQSSIVSRSFNGDQLQGSCSACRERDHSVCIVMTAAGESGCGCTHRSGAALLSTAGGWSCACSCLHTSRLVRQFLDRYTISADLNCSGSSSTSVSIRSTAATCTMQHVFS